MLTAQLEQIPVFGVYALAGKAGGRRIWQSRKKASHGIDTSDFKAAKNPEAG